MGAAISPSKTIFSQPLAWPGGKSTRQSKHKARARALLLSMAKGWSECIPEEPLGALLFWIYLTVLLGEGRKHKPSSIFPPESAAASCRRAAMKSSGAMSLMEEVSVWQEMLLCQQRSTMGWVTAKTVGTLRNKNLHPALQSHSQNLLACSLVPSDDASIGKEQCASEQVQSVHPLTPPLATEQYFFSRKKCTGQL